MVGTRHPGSRPKGLGRRRVVSQERTRISDNGNGEKERSRKILASMPTPPPARSADSSPIATAEIDLANRTLYLPRMPFSGSYLLAAAMRSIGLDCRVTPESDSRTMNLGSKYTSGDECYPQKVVMGDFMKILEDENGYKDVVILSLTSADGYSGIGEHAQELIRTGWRSVVLTDILMKLLLMTRPYEREKGQTDRTHQESLETLGEVISRPGVRHKERMEDLKTALRRIKESFLSIPIRNEDRPLIGVVGEIFCRLNAFSNEEMIRRIEDQGGEAWLAGVSEWIWYTTEEQFRRYREENRRFSRDWLKTMLTKQVQLRDEHALVEDFHDLFAGREEPHVPQLLELANPYLPSYGSMGEMVLSTGGAIYLHKKGADGIMDISPFTCMNGIITEAVYPKVSREHNNIPVRVFYFDGTQSDLDRDVGIFLELAKTYRRRKTTH